MVVLGQKGCLPAKVAIFEQNRLYSAKWLYSGKSSCLGKSCYIRAKVVVLGQSGCIFAKCLYSGKVVVIGQSGCIRERVVVFVQKW